MTKPKLDTSTINIPPPNNPAHDTTLNLAGILEPPPKSAPKRPKKARAPRTTPKPEPKPTYAKTSLLLPTSLAHKIRAIAAAQQRTHANIILTAFLNHHQELTDGIEVTNEPQRAALGLPPLRTAALTAKGSDEPRHPISLHLLKHALDQLDHTATSLAMTRTALIIELLTREFNHETSSDHK